MNTRSIHAPSTDELADFFDQNEKRERERKRYEKNRNENVIVRWCNRNAWNDNNIIYTIIIVR